MTRNANNFKECQVKTWKIHYHIAFFVILEKIDFTKPQAFIERGAGPRPLGFATSYSKI